MIKAYYLLTKPGIIYGNSLAAIAGFFLASKLQVDFGLFLSMLFGLGFVIASGCVFNNYIDRGLDAKMERTKRRALVAKTIPVIHALTFGTMLGVAGFTLLYLYTNPLTAFIAFVGFFFYVVMYSIFKRKSVFGTIVGSVSGAVPPVVGYVSVTNNLDVGAILLFLILVLWQMPHFYAIALFRFTDYKSTGLPVLPVASGERVTKIHIICYILALIVMFYLLTYFGYVGYFYLFVVITLSLIWLTMGLQGFKTKDTEKWAKKMFRFSLIVLLAFCVMISINSV